MPRKSATTPCHALVATAHAWLALAKEDGAAATRVVEHTVSPLLELHVGAERLARTPTGRHDDALTVLAVVLLETAKVTGPVAVPTVAPRGTGSRLLPAATALRAQLALVKHERVTALPARVCAQLALV